MNTKTYVGTKVVKATPMNRLNYNEYRGWNLPEDEDGTDEGYLVEYVDGGKSNHPDHEGYVSWSPKDVFEKAYKDNCSYIQRMKQEFKETYERLQGAKAFVAKQNFEEPKETVDEFNTVFTPQYCKETQMLNQQIYNMEEYLKVLGSRIVFAEAKEGLL